MKLQHLAVIFVLIIMPITIVISTYVNKLIDVSHKEAMYNTLLMNSTYDAVRAYQINTINNSFASVNASRVRDINASINSYFNSLATGLSSKGLTRNELEEYVPAILFTLYDGFYVYGPFENYTNIESTSTNYNVRDTEKQIQYGLKPYCYYTCEYKDGDNYHLIINYTLDNYITISGRYQDGGTEKYITKSGYYVNPDKYKVNNNFTVNVIGEGEGEDITIEPEELGEYIYAYNSKRIPQENGIGTQTVNLKGKIKYYRYINYNEEKYYYDDDFDQQDAKDDSLGYVKENGVENTNKPIPIFYLDKNLKIYISDNMLRTLANNRYGGNATEEQIENFRTGDTEAFKDVNNYYYYKYACEFSNEVYNILKEIDLSEEDVIQSTAFNNGGNYEVKAETNDGTEIKTEDGENGIHQKFEYNDDNGKIFDYKLEEDGKYVNDPETESSYFNQHRMDVIISDVETNLANTIANFKRYHYGTYDYRMPMISEDDWYKIANNVNIMSFLQGFAVGNYKFYNNYCVVADTRNKEFISREAIYVQEDIAKTYGPPYGAGYINNMVTNPTGSYDPENYTWKQANLKILYQKNNNNNYYHDPRCAKFSADAGNKRIIAYRAIDYEVDSFLHDYTNLNDDMTSIISAPDDKGVESVNYYMQSGTGGYECTVSMNDPMFTYDELITGTTRKEKALDGITEIELSASVRKAYLSALAREKGAAFKNFQFLNYDTENVNENLNP